MRGLLESSSENQTPERASLAEISVAIPPSEEQLSKLLALAKAGNMRAIRDFATDLEKDDEQHAGFAAQLRSLATSYQSPAILALATNAARQQKAN